MTMLIGIDEAGRGPVIGPMVMCAFAIEDDKEYTLTEMGVKDSKLIPPRKRELLYENLSENFKHEKVILSTVDIDNALNSPSINLNWLEAIASAKACKDLINRIDATDFKVIVDCPSINIQAYEDYFKNQLGNFKDKKITLLVEHKADANYPVAGGASVIAKVTRDTIISDLKKEIGIDFGSGYPADPKTKAFLVKYYDKYDIFRKSWATYKNVLKANNQQSLNNF